MRERKERKSRTVMIETKGRAIVCVEIELFVPIKGVRVEGVDGMEAHTRTRLSALFGSFFAQSALCIQKRRVVGARVGDEITSGSILWTD